MKPDLVKNIDINRSITSYAKVQKIYSNLVKCNPLQLLNKEINNKTFLNIGCGPNVMEDFINLDYDWLPGVDLVWDIIKGFPFIDNKFLGIYSEHCHEHITYDQAKFVLSEIFRTLKSTGVLRIIVPDASLYLSIYQKKKNGEDVSFPYGQIAHNVSDKKITSMMVVNSIFRGHGHLYAYDYETLEVLLKNQGFLDIKQEQFKSGRSQIMLGDTEYRACESLYIEAVKP